MFKKANNKVLAIVFVFLLAFVVLVNLMDARKGDRTFRNEIFDIDTADIISITIDPKGLERENVRLFKSPDGWKVSSGEEEYAADRNIVRNMLSELAGMTAQRVAATREDNWKKYEVTDSLATKVFVESENDEAMLYIGRFSYRQPRNPQQMQMPYGQQGTMSTYVRLGNENEVYSVEGFIGMTFNRDLDDFRNKTVLQSNRFEWQQLSFTYPADSSFTLKKTDAGWLINGNVKADSASVAHYLQQVTNLSSSHFVKDMQPQGSPVYTMNITGEGLNQPISVQAFPADSVYQYLISSSQNPGVYFNGAQADLAGKLFIGKSELLNGTEEE